MKCAFSMLKIKMYNTLFTRRDLPFVEAYEEFGKLTHTPVNFARVANLSEHLHLERGEELERIARLNEWISGERLAHIVVLEPACIGEDRLQQFRERGASGGDDQDVPDLNRGVGEELADDHRVGVEQESFEKATVAASSEASTLAEGDLAVHWEMCFGEAAAFGEDALGGRVAKEEEELLALLGVSPCEEVLKERVVLEVLCLDERETHSKEGVVVLCVPTHRASEELSECPTELIDRCLLEPFASERATHRDLLDRIDPVELPREHLRCGVHIEFGRGGHRKEV